MRHYENQKYIEWMAHNKHERKSFRPENLRAIKLECRGRERAALKRELAEELESWDDLEPERRYWHAKQMEHADEYERLYYEQLWIVETGEEPSELVRAAMDAENRLYSAACAELRAA